MKKKYLVIILIGLFLLPWMIGINDPYVGSYNANNNYLTLASKNYLRFGFNTLHYLPTYFASYPLPTQLQYYLHHPFLFFIINTLSFAIFGFNNWVVHILPFIFSFGSVLLTYAVTKNVFGKRIGFISLLFALAFPASALFWKFMMFEQATMFFNLCTLYLFLKFRKENTLRYLIFGVLSSFLSIACDWYGLYLLVPLIGYVFIDEHINSKKFILVHYFVVLFTVALFLGIIYSVQGNFIEVWNAISTRSVELELFGRSYWPFRYLFMILLRTLMYYSPMGIVAYILFFKLLISKYKSSSIDIPSYTLCVLFLIGIQNFLALPTATWGHTYFMWLLFPFMSAILAVWISKKSILYISFVLGIIFLWSIIISLLKYQQTSKQYWKYDVAKEISSSLIPFQTIGTVQFPGDIFEQYFLHPSEPIRIHDVTEWIDGNKHKDVQMIVFSCNGSCTEEELHTVLIWKNSGISVEEKNIQNNTVWILDKKPFKKNSLKYIKSGDQINIDNNTEKSVWYIFLYRKIRDIFEVGQI